jgi:hypothetical protein
VFLFNHSEYTLQLFGRFAVNNSSLVRVKHGEVLGGALYDEYNGTSIHMHVEGAVPNWLNRDALWLAFHYPFIQLDVKAIFGRLKSTNHKALEFDKKLGFKEITRISDMLPGADLVILKMLREDCKWLKIKPKTVRWNNERH